VTIVAEALGELFLSQLLWFVKAHDNLLTPQLSPIHGMQSGRRYRDKVLRGKSIKETLMLTLIRRLV